MLFSEVYSAYFHAVEKILREALEAPISPQRIDEIVREAAFAESVLQVGPALLSGEWPLLQDRRATVRRAPTMPLTELERRWLKALTLDPRIALFDPPAAGLEDVEPLFNPADVVWFDRYDDADPYNDPAYIANFRTALAAMRECRTLRVAFVGARGSAMRGEFVPLRLEYSQKDDKFRLIALGKGCLSIRMSSVLHCEPGEHFEPTALSKVRTRQVMLELEIADERNAPERVMLHFSHFRKEVERAGDNLYRMKLWYDPGDKSEMVIRILSFGPMVRVLSPKELRRQVIERLERQVELF